MAIVTAEIYFVSGDYIDSFVVAACTESGNMRVEELDTRGLLAGLDLPEIVDVVDMLEEFNGFHSYETGAFVPASMAVVASYVDAAYARYEGQREEIETMAADDFVRLLEALVNASNEAR